MAVKEYKYFSAGNLGCLDPGSNQSLPLVVANDSDLSDDFQLSANRNVLILVVDKEDLLQ